MFYLKYVWICEINCFERILIRFLSFPGHSCCLYLSHWSAKHTSYNLLKTAQMRTMAFYCSESDLWIQEVQTLKKLNKTFWRLPSSSTRRNWAVSVSWKKIYNDKRDLAWHKCTERFGNVVEMTGASVHGFFKCKTSIQQNVHVFSYLHYWLDLSLN